jgi:AcrR family transcriptional regulator
VGDPTPERGRLLSLVADHVLEHGVSDLTLRSISQGVGSNNRMLLYYFGSKERLLAEAITEAAQRFPRLALVMDRLRDDDRPLDVRLRAAWLDIVAEENLPYLRLFFELFGLAAHQPEKYGVFLDNVGTDWVERLAAVLADAGAPEGTARDLAVEVVALWRGLQFALLSGTSRAEVDRAHAASARVVADRVAADRAGCCRVGPGRPASAATASVSAATASVRPVAAPRRPPGGVAGSLA